MQKFHLAVKFSLVMFIYYFISLRVYEDRPPPQDFNGKVLV